MCNSSYNGSYLRVIEPFGCYALCQVVWHVVEAAACEQMTEPLQQGIQECQRKSESLPTIRQWLTTISLLLAKGAFQGKSKNNDNETTSLSVGVGSLKRCRSKRVYSTDISRSRHKSPSSLCIRDGDTRLKRKSSLDSLITVGSSSLGSTVEECTADSPELSLYGIREGPVLSGENNEKILKSRQLRDVQRLLDGLAEVCYQPANPFFAAAVWDIEDLLTFCSSSKDHAMAWSQLNILHKTPLIVALERYPDSNR